MGNTHMTPTQIILAECAQCGLRGEVEQDATGRLACYGCYVPDITRAKYQGGIEDFIVAPPNAKNVTPRMLA